ncbi:MAG: hypothetical protein ACKV2U_23730 [Bryobacteraceae bacterium]
MGEHLGSATCEQILNLVESQYQEWAFERRMLATPVLNEMLRDRRIAWGDRSGMRIHTACEDARAGGRQYLKIYREAWERYGNKDIVSKEPLERLLGRLERLIVDRFNQVRLDDDTDRKHSHDWIDLPDSHYDMPRARVSDEIKRGWVVLAIEGEIAWNDPAITDKHLTEPGSSRLIAEGLDPVPLWAAYQQLFVGKRIVIRDVCWAAKQHTTEWKRWLAGKLKVGSTPDMAFRRLLNSGKHPSEYRKMERPAGWE